MITENFYDFLFFVDNFFHSSNDNEVEFNERKNWNELKNAHCARTGVPY